MNKKALSITSLALLLTLLSLWLYPSAAPILGMAVLLFSLAVSIHSIFQKHKQAEDRRAKITKDILMLVFILLLVISLGGLAGLFAAQYAGSMGWGVAAMFLAAMLASFAVGYAVRWGVGKITKA